MRHLNCAFAGEGMKPLSNGHASDEVRLGETAAAAAAAAAAASLQRRCCRPWQPPQCQPLLDWLSIALPAWLLRICRVPTATCT